MRRIFLFLMLLPGVLSVVSCSSPTTAGHTGIFSYDEKRAKSKKGGDVPRMSFAVSVLFREKPSDGAVTELVNGITDKLPGHVKEAVSPWGLAANSLSLTPASGLSSIESGRRGQVFIPFHIDNPRDENQHVRITLDDIRGAAKKALQEEGVPPGKLDGVMMDSVSIEIHSVSERDTFDGFAEEPHAADNGS